MLTSVFLLLWETSFFTTAHLHIKASYWTVHKTYATGTKANNNTIVYKHLQGAGGINIIQHREQD